MNFISDPKQIKDTQSYLEAAAKEAIKSTCRKSQRGVVIVKDGKIIGRGYNKVTAYGLCDPCIRESIKNNSRAELCAAIHAEQMAILDAGRSGQVLTGSTMYHIKVKDGEMRTSSDISCTVCSRIIKESGIANFVLWQPEGYVVYDTEEFNKLSFDYFLKPQNNTTVK